MISEYSRRSSSLKDMPNRSAILRIWERVGRLTVIVITENEGRGGAAAGAGGILPDAAGRTGFWLAAVTRVGMAARVDRAAPKPRKLSTFALSRRSARVSSPLI